MGRVHGIWYRRRSDHRSLFTAVREHRRAHCGHVRHGRRWHDHHSHQQRDLQLGLQALAHGLTQGVTRSPFTAPPSAATRRAARRCPPSTTRPCASPSSDLLAWLNAAPTPFSEGPHHELRNHPAKSSRSPSPPPPNCVVSTGTLVDGDLAFVQVDGTGISSWWRLSKSATTTVPATGPSTAATRRLGVGAGRWFRLGFNGLAATSSSQTSLPTTRLSGPWAASRPSFRAAS